MLHLTVDDLARDDVANIAAIISEDNLSAALNFYDTAAKAFKFLAENPRAGTQFEPAIASLPGLRF